MVWIVNQPSATVASDSARSRALGALAALQLTRMNSEATAATTVPKVMAKMIQAGSSARAAFALR